MPARRQRAQRIHLLAEPLPDRIGHGVEGVERRVLAQPHIAIPSRRSRLMQPDALVIVDVFREEQSQFRNDRLRAITRGGGASPHAVQFVQDGDRRDGETEQCGDDERHSRQR